MKILNHTAASDGSNDFFSTLKENLHLLEKWDKYLSSNGRDTSIRGVDNRISHEDVSLLVSLFDMLLEKERTLKNISDSVIDQKTDQLLQILFSSNYKILDRLGLVLIGGVIQTKKQIEKDMLDFDSRRKLIQSIQQDWGYISFLERSVRNNPDNQKLILEILLGVKNPIINEVEDFLEQVRNYVFERPTGGFVVDNTGLDMSNIENTHKKQNIEGYIKKLEFEIKREENRIREQFPNSSYENAAELQNTIIKASKTISGMQARIAEFGRELDKQVSIASNFIINDTIEQERSHTKKPDNEVLAERNIRSGSRLLLKQSAIDFPKKDKVGKILISMLREMGDIYRDFETNADRVRGYNHMYLEREMGEISSRITEYREKLRAIMDRPLNQKFYISPAGEELDIQRIFERLEDLLQNSDETRQKYRDELSIAVKKERRFFRQYRNIFISLLEQIGAQNDIESVLEILESMYKKSESYAFRESLRSIKTAIYNKKKELKDEAKGIISTNGNVIEIDFTGGSRIGSDQSRDAV